MKRVNEERVEQLFRYLEILKDVHEIGHKLPRELGEAIQALRSELGLGEAKISIDKHGVYGDSLKIDVSGNVHIGSKSNGIKISNSEKK